MRAALYILLSLALLVTCFLLAHRSVMLTEGTLISLLAEGAPPGTPIARVRLLLDSLDISHGRLAASDRDAEWDSTSGPWVLYGSMRDFRRPHLGSDGLFLKFWLDADSIVVSHTVREVWGFP